MRGNYHLTKTLYTHSEAHVLTKR
uniref:Uncharacterized protein n=1 Tax=Anopheles arabiensis TaxID=7173 RepID=A0A182IGA1_ANOAR